MKDMRRCVAQGKSACSHRHPELRVLNPKERFPRLLAEEIITCDVVAASALHGIILADALRIPSLWLTKYDSAIPSWRTSQPDFKYVDYFEGAGVRAPNSVSTLKGALSQLTQRAALKPRFTTRQLLEKARRFIQAFPFDEVCGRSG
eukprot:1295183-Prymnesium_polylepis.1